MAFEHGGYADKLGNRYEGLWVAKQLLRLLDEQILSVTVEPVGDDEEGVDLIIEHKDGIKKYQQCKARNRSEESWSVGDLNIRKILSHMRLHLDCNPRHEFALVTGVPATVFGDMCDSARNSNGKSESFYKYQIQETGEARRKAFRQFCEYLQLDPQKPDERSAAFDYMRRTYIILWPDDLNSYEELLHDADRLVTGDPKNVIAALRDIAEQNLRRTLHANTILTQLTSRGYHTRHLAFDTRISARIKELQTLFADSLSPGLINRELIPRTETEDLLKALEDASLVILHGPAGQGKSGVLYELNRKLEEQQMAYLPIRLDRQVPKNTARQFGQEMGLPESPVHCLESVTNERGGVLILDQLDALRWTSAHSANSLDVCKSMVRELMSVRREGKALSVVLSCRTFDLEHDPEIKNWIENQKTPGEPHLKIEVKKLPEATVREVVEKAAVDFPRFSPRQKTILSSPLHLGLWAKIKEDGRAPDFQSATHLMREFWRDRYQALERNGITATEANVVLDTLVDYMEQKGKISAPDSLVLDQPRISTELHTHDIIRTENHKISFCHQSYLDFRIADRLLRRINTNQSDVRSWLGTKDKQSLFRREQLRHVLLLLSDESPADFLNTVKELLPDRELRFHLKHLILEVVGQIEEPGDDLCNYILELFLDDYWKLHVVESVFLKNSFYVQLLIDRGLAESWLNSEHIEQRNLMLWLLRSVSERIPDQITAFLAPFADREGDWPQQVLNCLYWNAKDDSDSMFNLRLKLARKGLVREYIHWKKFVHDRPLRTIQLIEAVISRWEQPRLRDNMDSDIRRGSRFEDWLHDDLRTLENVARMFPLQTWDMLSPHVIRLTSIEVENYDDRLDDWLDNERYRIHNGSVSICRGIVCLLCESGKVLAKDYTHEFLEKARVLNDSRSPVIQGILIASYSALPPQHADAGVKWLLQKDDIDRFSLGTGVNSPEWAPAKRLISNLSPHCSLYLFRKLEYSVIHYHSPNEKRMAQYYVPTWKKGYFGNFWGHAQYFLLPALFHGHRSNAANGLIGVLERKFGNYDKEDFLSRGRMVGGSITSPLSKEKLHLISDKAWLGILRNEDIPKDRNKDWKQISEGVVAECAVRHFASDLRTVARRYPQRFARLALDFPKNVHPAYVAAIMDGVKATEPKDIPEEEKASWEPAEIGIIESIIEKLPLGSNVANEFCWLIRERAEENWSDNTINRLLHYAINSPEPEPGKLIVNCDKTADEATLDDLHSNAINCVRGVAAIAIGSLLWEHPDWLERLRCGLEHLVNDPHPAVRVAAMRACLPILNINRDLAVELFVRACQNDGRVTACHESIWYFNCCTESHFEQLSPLVLAMVNSHNEEVAERGAAEMCARWLFGGRFSEDLERCRKGNVAQRKGVAKIASDFLVEGEYTEKCRDLLIDLFQDPDPGVRRETRRGFHNKEKLLLLPSISEFLPTYIESQAFQDDPSGLFFTFELYKGSLVPFSDSILAICETFAGPLADSTRDMSRGIAGDVHHLIPLLLRLYEQSKDADPETMNKCLDAWDDLYEKRVGFTRELTQQIDQ